MQTLQGRPQHKVQSSTQKWLGSHTQWREVVLNELSPGWTESANRSLINNIVILLTYSISNGEKVHTLEQCGVKQYIYVNEITL